MIIHHTTKYDGSIHYRYPVEIIAQTDTAIAVFVAANVPLHSYRGDFRTTMHILQLFFADVYHNISIAWEYDWSPRMHYVNIATPATWNDGRVTAIDLDLDLILKPETDKIILDDEDEFTAHIDRFGYPDELIRRCRAEVDRLWPAMEARTGVFGHDIFHWRPEDDLDPASLIPG